MAVLPTSLRKASLWVYIPVSFAAFTAGWTTAAVVSNLVDGDPAFSGVLSSFYVGVGLAALVTSILVALRPPGNR